MKRIGRIAFVKADKIKEYTAWHFNVYPEVEDLLRQAGIRNYTIFLSGRTLFSYLETDDWKAAVDFLSGQHACDQWQELLAPLMDATDPNSPWELMDEVFHLS